MTNPQHPVVHIKRLDDRAAIPAYHSEHAAGLDVAACLPRGDHSGDLVEILPGAITMLPTGLSLSIPVGYEGQVRPRSGLATRHGLTIPNAPGTIDADYRGELLVALINLGAEPVRVSHGDRIAQLVIAPVAHASVVVVESLSATARGERGFGSTGVRTAPEVGADSQS